MSSRITDLQELRTIAEVLEVEPQADLLAMLDAAVDRFLANRREGRGAEHGIEALLTELHDVEVFVRGMRKRIGAAIWVLRQLRALRDGVALPEVMLLALRDSGCLERMRVARETFDGPTEGSTENPLPRPQGPHTEAQSASQRTDG